MAAASEQWELSKENIQPIQRGRKPDVLKVALASHPEDLISQQKQAFETELRTYTGDDPLSVWYDYINWVEQNFPKGGRDGHLHQLIRQCLSQLISKPHYYNDNRFIEIWLKYANISQKAAEIYENMYTRNIGCKSAPYFMAWSWELEQQGNLKKANEVINKGIQCMAEPLEKLKAYRSEFEIRVANRVMSGGEQNPDLEENGRSAFSVLKPQKKKNVAPIVRVGASIVETNPSSLTLGRQQPMPKSNVPSTRVPFKIYNAENLPPSLPVQAENPQPFTFYTDAHKENEKKPSKWNKVQVKQAPSVVRSFADAAPGFTLHKDEDIPPASTPRSITSVSHVLKETKKPSSQDIDIFKPQEQKTRSMYDTTKVNIGGEEFSLEEIKAAAWFKAEKERKLIEQERKLQEQQALIKSLEQKLQLLEMEKKTNVAPASYSNMDPAPKIIIYSDPSPSKVQQVDNTNNPVISYEIPYEQENQSRGADIENVPPSDYIQDENKRELAGILQPSKNIPFIPLEDQYDEEEDEENPENEDCLYKENNNHPLQDETLIPPCNTEQFVSAAFLSSTPRTQVKPTNYTDLQCSFKEEAGNGKDEPKEPTGNEEKAVFQAPSEEATYSNRQVYKSEIKSSIREHSIFPALQGQLSVILETSRECYKSSSSSGSSGSATRLSQFSQCYSHEKSNIQRYLSKTDVFKEPRPVSHSRELSSNAPKDNSYCALKDIKSVGKSTAEKQNFEIHCTNIDPFDEALRNNFLASIRKSNAILENLPMSTKSLKSYKAEDKIEIAGVTYVINDLVAEGAYGKVYEASKQFSLEQNFDSSNTKFALKACRGSNDWEYYICSVLHERLNEVDSSPDVRSSVMKLFSACRYPNGIMLVSEFHRQGTLLDLVNLYKTQNTSMPEIFACFLTLEILQMVEKLHECKIVHCDIKPDNILVRDNMWDFDILEILGQKTALLQLIDFGRAIDLEMFQGGVCFNAKIKENCIEMRENKPWVFQLDWYGVLNCIHIILFSEYMKVKQNKSGRWEIEKKIKRYWDQTIWVPLFDELLNIPSCYKEPDLKKFTNMIVSKLRKNEAPFLTYFRRMETVYNHRVV